LTTQGKASNIQREGVQLYRNSPLSYEAIIEDPPLCQPFSAQAHIVSFSTPVTEMNRHIFMLSEKISLRNFGLIPSDYNKAADLVAQKFVVYSTLSKTITHS